MGIEIGGSLIMVWVGNQWPPGFNKTFLGREKNGI